MKRVKSLLDSCLPVLGKHLTPMLRYLYSFRTEVFGKFLIARIKKPLDMCMCVH
jgi:hypothetical protein